MDEKLREILEQYSLEVSAVSRGRGAFICRTSQGLKIVREYAMSPARLVFESMVKYIIRDRGYMNVDQIVVNKEGELYSKNKYDKNFIVKDWFDGTECNMKSREDVLEGASNLARLHRTMRQVHLGGESIGNYFYGGMKDTFEKHCREMKTIRNYMRSRKQKNKFESLYLEYYDRFAGQAMAAAEQLAGSDGYVRLLREAQEEKVICHGDYNQHNVIFLKGSRTGSSRAATVNFKMNINIQMNDLYLFLRKAMEKNQWDVKLALDMVRAYAAVRPINADEREYLCTLMLFPEKFWKIANHYYNTRKSWTSGRNQEKLEAFVDNCDMRDYFLESFSLQMTQHWGKEQPEIIAASVREDRQ